MADLLADPAADLRPLGCAVLALLLVACSAEPARQHRSPAAKHQFRVAHPCPTNPSPRGPCPGWIVDHVVPLACGGPDEPANMQWQTTADAKAKDRWEREGCSTPR